MFLCSSAGKVRVRPAIHLGSGGSLGIYGLCVCECVCLSVGVYVCMSGERGSNIRISRNNFIFINHKTCM